MHIAQHVLPVSNDIHCTPASLAGQGTANPSTHTTQPFHVLFREEDVLFYELDARDEGRDSLHIEVSHACVNGCMSLITEQTSTAERVPRTSQYVKTDQEHHNV